MHKTFAVISAILVALLAFAAWKSSAGNEWRGIQKNYYAQAMQKEQNELIKKSIADEKIQIKQMLIPSARVIDRCQSCHLGLTNPNFADAPQPYKKHPGDYLDKHLA